MTSTGGESTSERALSSEDAVSVFICEKALLVSNPQIVHGCCMIQELSLL